MMMVRRVLAIEVVAALTAGCVSVDSVAAQRRYWCSDTWTARTSTVSRRDVCRKVAESLYPDRALTVASWSASPDQSLCGRKAQVSAGFKIARPHRGDPTGQVVAGQFCVTG